MCEGDVAPEFAPAIAVPRLILIVDSEMKKLKGGKLWRDLKNRDLGTGCLKKYLQARLKKAMGDRFLIAPAVAQRSSARNSAWGGRALEGTCSE